MATDMVNFELNEAMLVIWFAMVVVGVAGLERLSLSSTLKVFEERTTS